ncbi:hypothetical protein [Methylobacterium sp. WL9]|uniref:hypothetical protein n=1 Tax=Methylobacterium sp. WL9 TaxID=2603898 RepID=UPI0011C9E0BA|nr:hypothetical protein [Methylobacterium sp. WL9]TXN22442.1 hypothetical protein FV217_10600 [Methylobacterium sp. WL9]
MPERATRNGRRLAALTLRAATAIVSLVLSASGPVQAFDCEALLKLHGLLRRASVPCSFTAYNETIVERARVCFEELGPEQGVADIRAGAGEFERMDAVRGRDALCFDLGRRFPMVVR